MHIKFIGPINCLGGQLLPIFIDLVCTTYITGNAWVPTLPKKACFNPSGLIFFNQLECLRVICSAISVGPHRMVQPIAMAVLKTFTMTNKDGAIHPRTMLAANSEGI